MNTNLLGVTRITKEFIPYFREKKKGTFLTTTSVAGFVAFPIGTIYNAIKFALEGWSESLSYELSAFNIKVKTIAPGGINTDFAGRSLDTVENSHYKEVESKMWAAFDNIVESASSADQVAEVVYMAATDDKDQIRYTAGEDAKAFAERLLEIGPENMRLEIKSQILG
ncbi:SDR family NAD(P)-dependent oxidoreductase [Chryseobacterium sp.]|uniref:SDR family NAD(P)-dependent oxidoreductase n=1 Tax=Chryseobacterium sp. TaxID=1871047 RepID=UPI0035C68846